MDSNPENYIYPTACNPCILRCSLENGKGVTTLFMEHTFDTMYVQLAFTDVFYKQDETLFRCDFMEAKDGGLPFLIVNDIIKIGSRTYEHVSYMIRYEFIRLLLEDPEFFDINSFSNEFRVRLPTLFEITQIQQVFDFIIPNLYGVANGVAFTKDGFRKYVKGSDENNYLLKKTKLPEVYELFLDGITPVPGNNVAYIPNIEVAKKVKNALEGRNSIRIRCSFDDKRQKWIPIF